MDSSFIIDNGASTIKAGLSTADTPHVIPNCKMKVKSERQRQYIGDQIDDCKDCSGLYYILPHQKGFILNWDTQREIWDYLINYKFKEMDTKETNLIITEPYFNFRALQNNTDEILFEEYGFKSILRTNTGYLSAMKLKSESNPLGCIVVDSGFSFTHIVPYVYEENQGFMKLKSGIRRIDVGGKALTNHLKEIISYRQINVMDETYVINQCKEDVCFVAQDIDKVDYYSVTRDYILPDFTNVRRGYVRKPEWKAKSRVDPTSTDPQFVRLANERFLVPEILFHPSDVGINQVGIVEAIVDSINSLPKQIRPILYKNIILIGGNVKISGFKDRVYAGVRSYCPSQFEVNVFLPDDPVIHPWLGGKSLANNHADILNQLVITKKQYDESGENKKQICVEKFDT